MSIYDILFYALHISYIDIYCPYNQLKEVLMAYRDYLCKLAEKRVLTDKEANEIWSFNRRREEFKKRVA